MKRSIYALGAIAALSLMVGGANAQPTPPPTGLVVPPFTGTGPAGCAIGLTPGTYTFTVEGINPYIYGIVGSFEVRPLAAGATRGLINNYVASSIIGTGPSETRRTGISYTRLETDGGGHYQINTVNDKYLGAPVHCPGGSITMNLSSRPMQYDFYFVPFGQGFAAEIYLVSTVEGRPATGRARLSPYSGLVGCPAGANPLVGYAAFTARDIDHDPARTANGRDRAPGTSPNYGISGMWSAYAGFPINSRIGPLTPLGPNDQYGTLDIIASSNLGSSGSVTRVEADFGKWLSPAFSVFPNAGRTACSGSLTFNMSSFPVQFDYWWYSPFEIVFISTNALPIMGEAKTANLF